MVCKQIILKLVYMRFVVLFLLIYLIACDRNHSSVLVKVYSNDNNEPLSGAKVEVIRKGKEGFLTDKEHLLVGEDYTNSTGEVLVNFKYDSGNKYALFVYEANDYFQSTSYQYFDLETGKNEVSAYMDQLSYIKLNLKSITPGAKKLNIKINNFESFYYTYFPYQSNPIDTMVFCKARSSKGNKDVTWSVDSSGYEKNYSLPVELKGHDTAYVTINF